nr:hypothetical protein PHYPA_028812 [Physcomitrium patens]
MAERVQKFLHKTPPRFHVLPARVGISQLLEMEKPKSPKLTMPKTPEFQTMRRIRSSRFKSAEEIEIEELAKIPKFKARPLNKRVFQSSGDLGLLRIHKRKVTVPMEFRSETSRRAQVRNSVLRIQEFDKEQGLVKLIRTVGSTVEREQKDAGALISEVQYILSNAPIFTPVQSTNPLAEISQSKLNINQQALEYEKKKKEKKVNNAMRRKVIAQPAPQFDEPSIPQRSMKGLTKATLPILNLKAPGAELTTSYSWAEEIPLEQKRIFMR